MAKATRHAVSNTIVMSNATRANDKTGGRRQSQERSDNPTTP
ncbi:MAG: hypothetical protein THHGLFOP_001776, partial [Candidatus Fervidibacter sp.]